MEARTGLVLASGYANKLRRVIFAIVKDKIKLGEITQQQVAYRVGQLNAVLFKILAEMENVKKDDVVRIIVPFDVVNGDLVFNYKDIIVQLWRHDIETEKRIKEALEKLSEKGLVEREFNFALSKEMGPVKMYDILLDNENVGKLYIMVLQTSGDNLTISYNGVVTINGERYRIAGVETIQSGEPLEIMLRRIVNSAITEENRISESEAEKLIEEISKMMPN